MASSTSSARGNNKAATTNTTTATAPVSTASSAAVSGSGATSAAATASAPPAVTLSELIGQQLKHLNADELLHKDELQLLLLITPVQRQKLSRNLEDGDLEASTSAAPLSRPENGEEDDDLIGAVGGLGISSPTTTKEPVLDFR